MPRSFWAGRDPRELVVAETDEALHVNRIGQILCALQPLAAFAAMGQFGGARFIVAGYSVGEMPAWSLAGLWSPETALDLTARRAEPWMRWQPLATGCCSWRGLDPAEVDALCRQFDIERSRSSTLAGPSCSVARVTRSMPRLVAAEGGRRPLRVLRLGVNVASHTSRLASAPALFRKGLDSTLFSNIRPTRRLLSGSDGAHRLDGRTGLDNLAAQISSTVHWSDCWRRASRRARPPSSNAARAGHSRTWPTAAFPTIPARSVDDFRTLQGLSDWLRRVDV